MTRDGENKKREYAEDEPLEEGKEIPLAKSMNNVAKELMEGLFDTNSFIRRTARKDPCAVYVNVGTVPNTGYSLFARRSLKEGEVLSIPSTTISLDSKSSVASVAFLLKPHPTKANVRANLTFSGAKDRPDGRIELVATKPIEEGHELYSALADHPLMTSAGLPSYFQTMPTPEEYELEESIRKDVLLTTKRISVSHRKKGIHVFPEKQLMALTRRTLAKIDTRLERVMRTSEEYSLGFHQRASARVDDTKVESSRLKATKDFETREVIAYLPLHSTPCTTNPCVGRHPCRLSLADGSTICPLLGVWPQSSDRPNIKIELMDEEQKQAGENKTAWKFTASRTIQAGDEVRTVLLDILARNECFSDDDEY